MRRGRALSAMIVALLAVAPEHLGCSTSDPGSEPDTDGDGLSDEEELNVTGTSPLMVDTDGDGLSDYQEAVELGFDPTNDPSRFNPRVSDLPLMIVVLAGPPVLTMDTSDALGATHTIEDSISNEVATSTTYGESPTFSESDTFSSSVQRTHEHSVTTPLDPTGSSSGGDTGSGGGGSPGSGETITVTADAGATASAEAGAGSGASAGGGGAANGEGSGAGSGAGQGTATGSGAADGGAHGKTANGDASTGAPGDTADDASASASADASASASAEAGASADASASADAAAQSSSSSEASATGTVTVSPGDGGEGGGGGSGGSGGGGSGGTVTLTDSVATTFSPSTTFTTSITYSRQQMFQNAQTLAETESLAASRTTTVLGGFLKIPAIVENRGHVAFNVTNVTLGAAFVDPSGAVIAVQNLFSDEGLLSTFEPFALAPGDQAGPQTYTSLKLTLQTAQAILARSRSLVIHLVAWNMTDAEGKSFAFRAQDIGAKTATLAIDYGGLRPPEIYQVATNLDPRQPGVTAGRVFSDILRIPHTADSSTGLTGVRNLNSATSGGNRWVVEHLHNDGTGLADDPYDPDGGGYDFDQILVRAGDVLHLAFRQHDAPPPWDGGSVEPIAVGPTAEAGADAQTPAVVGPDGKPPDDAGAQVPTIPGSAPQFSQLPPLPAPGGGAPPSEPEDAGLPPTGP